MDLRKRRLFFGGFFFALMFFYHGTTLYFQFVQVGSYLGWRGKAMTENIFTPRRLNPIALRR